MGPDPLNLVEPFLAHAEARPGQPAIVPPNGPAVSYAALATRSADLASAYRRAGIGQGDVVLMARGVSPELYAGLLALFRLGAVAMFPEPAAGLKGLRLGVRAVRPKAVVTAGLGRILRPFVPELRRLPLLGDGGSQPGDGPLVDAPPDSPALITFTSGSTGRPKGIVRSAAFLQLQARLVEDLRATTPDDVDLISLPVFILANLLAGATSVIPAGNLRRPAELDGGALRAQIARYGVNRVLAPPSICARLAEGGAPLPGLSRIYTGGGPVFPNLLQSLQAIAPNGEVHAVYGSTEAEPIAHVAAHEVTDADWRAMADGAGLLAGAPIPEIEVAIVDDEIQVAGPHVNRGYLDPADDASTKVLRDGRLWHRTGDAGRLDAQGRLWLLGRREAASGGLYPFAVETAALSWPGVRQASLLTGEGPARLFVAGEGLDRADLAKRAERLGDIGLAVLSAIPMDKRHNAKVDYVRLRAIAGR